MADKTLDQLTALASLSGVDLFAVYDTANAVLRKMAAQVLIDLLIDQAAGTYLVRSSNLSDLTSASDARANLGLGTAAVQNVAAFLQPANNLSDVPAAATARTNLGLGSLATLSQVPNGSIGNTQLAAGAALANLGYTPVNAAGGSSVAGLTTFTKAETGNYGQGGDAIMINGQGGAIVWNNQAGSFPRIICVGGGNPTLMMTLGDGNVGKIYFTVDTGTVTAVNLTATSDGRLKKNVRDYDDAQPLRPVLFEWKDGEGPEGDQLGFIAQDVEVSAPWAVIEATPGRKSINPVALCAVLAAQVNDLTDRLKALEAA